MEPQDMNPNDDVMAQDDAVTDEVTEGADEEVTEEEMDFDGEDGE